jgi:glucose/mannose-6-phosphate isomerase
VGALVAPLCTLLYRLGLAQGAHACLLRAQEQLAKRRAACGPEVEGAANPARELARRIGRTIPLIYGGGAIGAVAAYRWKCDVNENAKAPAFWNTHPELDHNEICAWGQHGDVTRQLITVVELRHSFEHGAFDAVRLRATSSTSACTRCCRSRRKARTGSRSSST